MLRRFSVTSRPAIDSSLYKNDLPISSAQGQTKACLAQDDKTKILTDLATYVDTHARVQTFPVDGSSWSILSPMAQAIKAKIEKYGIPLKDWDVEIKRGVLCGLSEAFIIDGATKNRLISEDPKSAEIIRPILRGKDIKRYSYSFADKWLIVSHNGYVNSPPIDVTRYPAIKAWLDSWEPRLSKRYDKGCTTYNLRDCAYMSLFSQPKIIWGELARTGPAFTYDGAGYYVSNTGYILSLKSSVPSSAEGRQILFSILGVLNSRLILFYLDSISSKLDVTGWRWLNQFVIQLPVVPVNERLAALVERLLSAPQQAALDECEKLVFDLYHLTDNERDFLRSLYSSPRLFSSDVLSSSVK